MLRDMLVEMPGVTTWPCDEINYIWRHGNVRFESDEFTPEMATPGVSKYISHKFDQLASTSGAGVVVEKTCANSLRVGFVDKVIPEAKYIFIVRDGYDVVSSALKRWNAQLELQYILKKARFVPVADLPYYASRYLLNRLYRLFSGSHRLAFWGPRLVGMQQLLEEYTLPEVCALQWKRCVESAEQAFAGMQQDRIIRVSYEQFVAEPVAEYERIARFVDKDVSEQVKTRLNNSVTAASVGRGRSSLSSEQMCSIEALIGDTLERYGYQ